MRELPKLTDTLVRAVLQTHYGLSTKALTFLPIGNDSMSFVYHVDASDCARYFLKVRAGASFFCPKWGEPAAMPCTRLSTYLHRAISSRWLTRRTDHDMAEQRVQQPLANRLSLEERACTRWSPSLATTFAWGDERH